jgi:hypothetical protein
MARPFDSFLDRILHRSVIRRWATAADGADDLPAETLARLRGRARGIRRHLDRVIHAADHRLALPAVGSNAMRRPPGTDWSWRPDLWRGTIPIPGRASVPSRTEIAPGLKLFHDCRRSELSLRQIRNTREADVAPYGLRMDVFGFDGSFLSLVLDLPGAAVQGLRLKHIIRLEALIEMEKPLEIYARLNVRHGPNVAQIVRELPLAGAEVTVEFDLAHARINERRVEGAWIDLIFEGPEMNQVVLRDVTLTRRPRAEV